jgi:hypothetical protein
MLRGQGNEGKESAVPLARTACRRRERRRANSTFIGAFGTYMVLKAPMKAELAR